MIIKPLPHDATQNFNLSSGTVQIGDTLFVNGAPHKVCGRCAQIIGSNDYERKLTSRGATKSKGKIIRDGKVSYESKPYMISILLGWIKLGEEIVYEGGFPTVKEHFRPKLIQKPACFNCWNLQQRRGEWFKIEECEK